MKRTAKKGSKLTAGSSGAYKGSPSPKDASSKGPKPAVNRGDPVRGRGKGK